MQQRGKTGWFQCEDLEEVESFRYLGVGMEADGTLGLIRFTVEDVIKVLDILRSTWKERSSYVRAKMVCLKV